MHFDVDIVTAIIFEWPTYMATKICFPKGKKMALKINSNVFISLFLTWFVYGLLSTVCVSDAVV